MKKIILTSVLLATAVFTTGAFAAANSDFKAGGTNSNGSLVGKDSSQVTGNGGVVGDGNGKGTNTYGGTDQTTAPGSRSDALAGLNNGHGGVAPGQAKQ